MDAACTSSCPRLFCVDRCRTGDTLRDRGLGSAVDMTLKAARAAAEKLRAFRRKGLDPIADKRTRQAAQLRDRRAMLRVASRALQAEARPNDALSAVQVQHVIDRTASRRASEPRKQRRQSWTPRPVARGLQPRCGRNH